jgi:hypothetical protein
MTVVSDTWSSVELEDVVDDGEEALEDEEPELEEEEPEPNEEEEDAVEYELMLVSVLPKEESPEKVSIAVPEEEEEPLVLLLLEPLPLPLSAVPSPPERIEPVPHGMACPSGCVASGAATCCAKYERKWKVDGEWRGSSQHYCSLLQGSALRPSARKTAPVASCYALHSRLYHRQLRVWIA